MQNIGTHALNKWISGLIAKAMTLKPRGSVIVTWDAISQHFSISYETHRTSWGIGNEEETISRTKLFIWLCCISFPSLIHPTNHTNYLGSLSFSYKNCWSNITQWMNVWMNPLGSNGNIQGLDKCCLTATCFTRSENTWERALDNSRPKVEHLSQLFSGINKALIFRTWAYSTHRDI